MSLKFNKVDTVSLFLKGIGKDCEWSHYLLRLLAEFMVELRLEPIKARGLSIVLDIPLQRQSYQNQGKSGWSKISWKTFLWRRCAFSLFINICSCSRVQAPIMLCILLKNKLFSNLLTLILKSYIFHKY